MKKDLILTDEELIRLEEIYKLFSSASRLKILIRLTKGACPAGELSEFAGLSQSATSHQLKDLKNNRVVKTKKEGLKIIYSLDDYHIASMLESGIEHIKGDNCNEG